MIPCIQQLRITRPAGGSGASTASNSDLADSAAVNGVTESWAAGDGHRDGARLTTLTFGRQCRFSVHPPEPRCQCPSEQLRHLILTER